MSKLHELAGKLSNLPFRAQWLITLLMGSVNVFSFAPFGFWPLQILGLAVLFFFLSAQTNIRRAAALGWAYSFAWIGVSISWIVVALTRYGGLPLPLGVLAIVLLSAFLALYAALFAGCSVWMRQRWSVSAGRVLLMLLPALWMISEWLRGWLLTGFPWAIAGYAHTDSPLAGYAPLMGVYGLSYLSALLAALLVFAWLSANKRRPAGMALAGLCLIFAVGAGLRMHTWTALQGKPLSVRLLQGNVEQDMKFNEAHLIDSLILYHDMVTAQPADLIVTPETALPVLSSMLPPDYLPRLNDFVQRTRSALIIGVALDNGNEIYSNSVLGFSPDYSKQAYRYDKHHLLPFGEFVPTGFHWFVKMMQIPIGDFSSAGLYQQPMAVRDQFVMPDICYESLFGEEIAQQLFSQYRSQRPVASILLNASNLAWYGDSIAMPQHLQFARMRVLETGRPLISATNTGATVIIDADAKVQKQAPLLSKFSLNGEVQGRSGLTPYIILGNTFIVIFAVLMLIGAILLSRRKDA